MHSAQPRNPPATGRPDPPHARSVQRTPRPLNRICRQCRQQPAAVASPARSPLHCHNLICMHVDLVQRSPHDLMREEQAVTPGVSGAVASFAEGHIQLQEHTPAACTGAAGTCSRRPRASSCGSARWPGTRASHAASLQTSGAPSLPSASPSPCLCARRHSCRADTATALTIRSEAMRPSYAAAAHGDMLQQHL